MKYREKILDDRLNKIHKSKKKILTEEKIFQYKQMLLEAKNKREKIKILDFILGNKKKDKYYVQKNFLLNLKNDIILKNDVFIMKHLKNKYKNKTGLVDIISDKNNYFTEENINNINDKIDLKIIANYLKTGFFTSDINKLKVKINKKIKNSLNTIKQIKLKDGIKNKIKKQMQKKIKFIKFFKKFVKDFAKHIIKFIKSHFFYVSAGVALGAVTATAGLSLHIAYVIPAIIAIRSAVKCIGDLITNYKIKLLFKELKTLDKKKNYEKSLLIYKINKLNDSTSFISSGIKIKNNLQILDIINNNIKDIKFKINIFQDNFENIKKQLQNKWCFMFFKLKLKCLNSLAENLNDITKSVNNKNKNIGTAILSEGEKESAIEYINNVKLFLDDQKKIYDKKIKKENKVKYEEIFNNLNDSINNLTEKIPSLAKQNQAKTI